MSSDEELGTSSASGETQTGKTGEEEEEKQEEEEEVEGVILDEQNIVPHLGILGSPTDLEFVYTKLLMNESEVKDASILSNYPHLRFISLASNALRKVPWLSAMTDAVHIDLHGNSIKTLPEFDSPIPNLINFLLQGNKIRHIPVFPFPILTKLDLSENAIRTIAPSAFAQIESLTYLKLSHNKIQQITSDTFKGLKKLQRLELDNNKVKRVADNAWIALEALTSLDLSENQLTSVKSFAIPLPKLTVLSLAGNQIPNVSALSPLKESAALRQLTTTGNPLNSEDEYRLCIIHSLPQLLKVDDNEEITKEDRDSAAEFVAQKLAEEEEQHRLEAEARRAEEEDDL
jgi:Leucine-rich repeat (LRR) protein